MKPLVVIPTHASLSYITYSLSIYVEELNIVREKYPLARMLVVVNGISKSEIIEIAQAVKGFMNKYDYCDVHMLFEVGKNNAISYALDYARKKDFDIVHLLDDDVALLKQSVLRNCDAFYSKDATNCVVGSKFVPHDKTAKEMINLFGIKRGVARYFWRNVFSVPYKEGNVIKSCSGQSICFSPLLIESIPADVADDAYITLQALKAEGEVIHPENSVVCFEPAHTFKDWYKQKTRTALAVALSVQQVEPGHLEKKVAHKFSYLKQHREPLLKNGYPLKRLFHAVVLRLCIQLIDYKVEKLLRKNIKNIGWNTVQDSKPKR